MQLANFEDGLWDLLLGAVFMFQAIYPVTRERLGPAWNLALYMGLIAALVLAMTAVRRIVSVPRVGYVRTRRSPGMKVALVGLVILVALTVGLVLLTLLAPEGAASQSAVPAWLRAGQGGWRDYRVEIVTLLLTGVVFSVLGYVMGVTRVYAYGWLLGGAFLFSAVIYRGASDGFNAPMGAAAGVIMLIGAVLLVRFLRRYPVPVEGAHG
jgi:uncharacterized BrkB/YihY/UPF0761 family membrane protein